jgi:PAS domain S-box-containing protein
VDSRPTHVRAGPENRGHVPDQPVPAPEPQLVDRPQRADWKRLQSLFMQAPAAIALMDGPEHVFELVNPLYEQMVGKTADNLLGKPGREVLPRVTDGHLWDLIDGAYATGEPFSAREVPLRIDSEAETTDQQRWFNLVAQPTRDGDGTVEGILIHAVEVTEQVLVRYQAEELAAELEAERARLSLGQRIGKIGTFDRDVRTRKVIWTADLETLYGYEAGELRAADIDWMSLVFPDDRARVRTAIERSMVERHTIHIEFRAVRKNGSMAWILADGMVEYDGDGSPCRVIGVNVDITERKQAEDNLKFLSDASRLLSSSLDFETTLNTVAGLAAPGVGDWCSIEMLDSNGELQLVAVAHKDPERVEWARELRENSPTDLSAPQGVPEVLRTGKAELYPIITDEMLVGMARDERELTLARSLGMTSAMIVPISSNGVPIGAITFVTTESRRRYTEADMAMAEELASRASLAIDNARLYRTAQEALALRDEFISIASHELKTPVTSLKVYAQMLGRQAQRKGDTATASQLAKMESQVDKLTKLIANLLDVSKIEAGKLEYVLEELDLVALVCELAESPKAIDQTHVIRVRECQPIIVSADRERIGQVIVNLLTNAIKYSPDADRIDVTVSCDGDTATVAVHDYGIGIDSRFHEHLFDRFFQVADPEERTFPGLGMGLYISREIARRHGGDIRVESSKGSGSTFSLVLPVAHEANPDSTILPQ